MRQMTGEEWIEGLNRLRTGTDLPLTLQGGEPTLHKDFFSIINRLRPELALDLMTNFAFDVDEFMQHVSPDVFKRDSKYANIRVSYHNGHSDFSGMVLKVKRMMDLSYSIGIWEILHPDDKYEVKHRQAVALCHGVDYRLKEYLGPLRDKWYGTMKYDQAVGSSVTRECMCKTSELIIAPDGNIYRCHSDLYAGRGAIGHLLDEKPPKLGLWRACTNYGKCNSCDIKVTTNRFQEYGHSSVEIKDVKSPTSSGSE